MSKKSKQQAIYDFYSKCSEFELENDYNCYLSSYSHEAIFIKLVANLRGFDTSGWKEFYR